VSSRGLGEAYHSPLRQYVGQRINLFRAMHVPGAYLDDDRTVLALREGDYALTARVVFDAVFGYFYVGDCHWYRCDLTRAAADEVPEGVRQNLIPRFFALLG
jgi:hypothetical protein